MEGISDQPVEIDFGMLVKKKIFLKGFFRGGINSYRRSLDFIERHKEIRGALDILIDDETEINGNRGFHDVVDEKHLPQIFEKASEKDGFGRLIIRKLR